MRRFLYVLVVIAGCQPAALSPPQNFHRVSERLFSGSTPSSDAEFDALRRLGVRTIISVDGAPPDVEAARRHELRYVHLPIGYDGIAPQQAMRLARAVRDLPGPVYLHCHHGKHRGPAAAVTVCRLLSDEFDLTTAEAFLTKAGTDPRYVGLWRAVREARRVTDDALDAIPADFPATTPVPAITAAMVRIDEHWDQLRRLREMGWSEGERAREMAVLLREEFRELQRLPIAVTHGETILQSLRESEQGCRLIEEMGAERELGFERVRKQCAQCHQTHRDTSSAR